MAPIRFTPIHKKTVWGGPELGKLFNRKCDARTGESWELSDYGEYDNVAENGPFKGLTLGQILATHRREILGDDHYMRFHDHFPLILKTLCAHDRLSLQVHPSDEFAQRHEVRGNGKMEAWYILHAPKDSRVIRGVLPGTTVSEFRNHLEQGTVEQVLNVMEVSPGDLIFLPPGTIHSAFGGLVVLEVQQRSETTYRLFDWDRPGLDGKPRQLHVPKAMNVTDFYSMGVSKYKPFRIPTYTYKRRHVVKCEKFTMESIELGAKKVKERTDPARFQIFSVVRGTGKFSFGPKLKKSEAYKAGQTWLIPAHLGEFAIQPRGAGEILVTYI